MILQFYLETQKSLDDVRAVVDMAGEGAALVPERKQAYAHIEQVLRRFSYWKLGRADKGLVRQYLDRTTGFSQSRLIARYRAEGHITDRRRGPAKPFRRKYGPDDVALLAETDALHGMPPGPVTLAILKRSWEVLGDPRFERLAGLSSGHLYNLRRSKAYRRHMEARRDTRPTGGAVGQRPRAQPSLLRVDSVNQGDLAQGKGPITYPS